MVVSNKRALQIALNIGVLREGSQAECSTASLTFGSAKGESQHSARRQTAICRLTIRRASSMSGSLEVVEIFTVAFPDPMDWASPPSMIVLLPLRFSNNTWGHHDVRLAKRHLKSCKPQQIMAVIDPEAERRDE